MTEKKEIQDDILNVIDEYIGSRIRIRRNLLGLSQDQLAKNLNISFQQVQKYEKGNNRIAGSRIWQLARTLNIPVSYFFDGIESSLLYKGYDIDQYSSDCLCEPYDDEELPIIPQGMENSVKELVEAFVSIEDKTVALQFLGLIKSITEKEKNETTKDNNSKF